MSNDCVRWHREHRTGFIGQLISSRKYCECVYIFGWMIFWCVQRRWQRFHVSRAAIDSTLFIKMWGIKNKSIRFIDRVDGRVFVISEKNVSDKFASIKKYVAQCKWTRRDPRRCSQFDNWFNSICRKLICYLNAWNWLAVGRFSAHYSRLTASPRWKIGEAA